MVLEVKIETVLSYHRLVLEYKACRSSGTLKHANVTDDKSQQSGFVVQPVALISSSVATVWFSQDAAGALNAGGGN